jgi:hypothetical protein
VAAASARRTNRENLLYRGGNGGFAVVEERVRSERWGRSGNELVVDVWDLRVEIAAFAGEGVLFAARTAACRSFVLGSRESFSTLVSSEEVSLAIVVDVSDV